MFLQNKVCVATLHTTNDFRRNYEGRQSRVIMIVIIMVAVMFGWVLDEQRTLLKTVVIVNLQRSTFRYNKHNAQLAAHYARKRRHTYGSNGAFYLAVLH